MTFLIFVYFTLYGAYTKRKGEKSFKAGSLVSKVFPRTE